MNVIRIAVALVRNSEGPILLVRKHGTGTFMQPGGKIEEGERASAALAEAIWFDPVKHAHVELAPLTKDHILPLAARS